MVLADEVYYERQHKLCGTVVEFCRLRVPQRLSGVIRRVWRFRQSVLDANFKEDRIGVDFSAHSDATSANACLVDLDRSKGDGWWIPQKSPKGFRATDFTV
jgi:hypothetical protein